jgi:hypothetical protein
VGARPLRGGARRARGLHRGLPARYGGRLPVGRGDRRPRPAVPRPRVAGDPRASSSLRPTTRSPPPSTRSVDRTFTPSERAPCARSTTPRTWWAPSLCRVRAPKRTRSIAA